MCLAGLVGSGDNFNEFSGPAGEKNFPDWLLRWAWTIPAVVLLALIAAGAVSRNCRLARGLLLSGTLHCCLDLGLLAALSGWFIGCLASLDPAEHLGFFSVRRLGEAIIMGSGVCGGLGCHGNGHRSNIDRISLFARGFPIPEPCVDSGRLDHGRLWGLICRRVVFGRFGLCNTDQCAETGIMS